MVGQGLTAHALDSRGRLHGYRTALVEAGIPFDPGLVAAGQAATVQGGITATRGLLDADPLPSAIFAVNNLAAVGAIMAIRERGLDVPDDIAVVCFDDIELAALLQPFLTVMAQPAETFGTLAAQLLLDRIAGRAIERRRRVVLPADLIVRLSCGSPAAVPA